MNMLPATKHERWKLALFPFVVYTFAVPFVVVLAGLISTLAGWGDLGTSWYGAHEVLERERAHRVAVLEYGYVGCIVAFVIGAFYTRETRARRFLLILVVAALFSMLVLYPATQVLKTR